MSDNKKDSPRVRVWGVNNIRPLQALPYEEKIKDDNQWGKDNIDFYIERSGFDAVNIKPEKGKEERLTKSQLYDLYNSRIDESIFGYVTNPLNSKSAVYKSFPAKLRAYNIIRPNIDLLIGEWNTKQFKYDVLNLDGDEVLNSFQAEQYALFTSNLEQRFVNEYNKIQKTILPTLELKEPSEVLTELNANFKDVKAIKGYKALKVLELDLKLKEKFKKLFKDYIIAGDCYSLKIVNHNTIDYRKLSTLGVGAELGGENYIEDGEWATAWFRMSVSDVVDLFYDVASKEEIEKVEKGLTPGGYGRQLFWNSLQNTNNKTVDGLTNWCDVYFGTWKSRRLVKIVGSINPMTNETELEELDESYIVDKEKGEWLEREEWINEVHSGWRVNKELYFKIGPHDIQRQEVDNISRCKLPINGTRFSDTESNNTSVAQLGVVYQIMYIVMIYRLELAIAKSKGIVQFIDENIIPQEDGEEGEEKWMYRAEALGWAYVNFNQDGANRQFNQFPHADFSQMKTIVELKEIAEWFKTRWDELIGMTPPRKGQTNSRDGLGVTQESIFRGSVISDIVFDGFDDFIETELQGLLDLSKFAWIDGKSSYYKNDDGTLELFKIDPLDHSSASYKVYADFKGRYRDKLKLLKDQINAVAQRKDVKMSTIADMIFSDSYAEIRAKLKQAEAAEQKLAQQSAESEHQRAEAIEALKKEYMIFENMLSTDFMEREQDRLDGREYIKGLVKQYGASVEGIDIDAISKEADNHLDRLSKERTERMKIESNERIARMNDITKKLDIEAKLKNKVVGEK